MSIRNSSISFNGNGSLDNVFIQLSYSEIALGKIVKIQLRLIFSMFSYKLQRLKQCNNFHGCLIKFGSHKISFKISFTISLHLHLSLSFVSFASCNLRPGQPWRQMVHINECAIVKVWLACLPIKSLSVNIFHLFSLMNDSNNFHFYGKNNGFFVRGYT